MSNRSPVTTCLLAVLAFQPEPAGAQSSYFLITSEKLNCVRYHATTYLSSFREDVIFIRPEDCGIEAGSPVGLLEFAENAAPDLSGLESESEDDLLPDKVIALTREDLACLPQLAIPTESRLLAYYPGTCHVEPR